jgi:RNA polymerase sigma-70 factor (TIGR02960 family)
MAASSSSFSARCFPAALVGQVPAPPGVQPDDPELRGDHEAGEDAAALEAARQPLRVGGVPLGPAGQVLDLAGVGQHALQPFGLQPVEHRLPVVRLCLHDDGGHLPAAAHLALPDRTNRCLNARRSASRRPAKEWDVPNVEPPEPTRLGEVVWLEPFPDALLEGAIDVPLGPEARYEQTESVSLAFVTALQVLPPRQLAVLILRNVLGFHASEVAGMMDSTVESVKSALKRAHASLQRQRPATDGREPPPAFGSPSEDAIVAKFVRAWESADLDALVALLTDDVFMSMPPMPFEYEGRDVVARFCASIFGAGRRFDLVPTRANGQPAFGAYLRAPDGIGHGMGLYVLTLAGDRICAMTRFENSVLPWFGLPRSLPSP